MEPAQITVNGEERTLVPAGPHTNLLDWLRAQGLTGAKEGCAEGECGACAVLVARPDDAAEGADGGTLGAGMQGGGPVQHAGGNQYDGGSQDDGDGRHDGGTHLDHGSQHDDGAHHGDGTHHEGDTRHDGDTRHNGDGTHHEGDTRHGDGAQAGAAPVTAGRSRWTAINACLPPALALDGQEILTAEGLGTAPGACATGDLHPVQQEMARRGGSQCGYCTPGFICAMAAEYYRPGRLAQTDGVHAPGTDTGSVGRNGFDLHALSGNLCRCTGYRPIRDAAYALTGPAPEDPLALRHHRPAAPARNTTWVTGGAQFIRPASLTELLERYGQEPGATLLAGATDLGVDINLRHERPSAVLAIDHLPELRTWEVTDHRIEIGAALTLSEIERTLSGRVPLLAELLPQFASPLIRNTATLGGNIATASPIGDAAPVLLALDASLVLVSAAGEREVRLADYFTGYRRTVRHPGEVIRAIRIPRPLAPVSAFYKMAKRRFDDISSVAVAIAMTFDGDQITKVHVGLGGVAATPIRARATEAALTGQAWTAETSRRAAQVMAGEGTPMDDHRASAAYRSAMLEQSMLRFFDRTSPGEGR